MKFNKHYLVGTMRTVKMVPAHSPNYTQNKKVLKERKA